MKKNIVLAILWVFLSVSFLTENVLAENQKLDAISQVYTLEYPPFCFTKDGKLTGFATEIVHEIMKRLQTSYNIKSLPWKRGYKYLSDEPNVVLFTVTRTPHRENLFKWAGPIITSNLVFFAKGDAKIAINRLEDAKSVDKIGLVQGYSVERYLRQHGFTNLDTVSGSENTNPLKLMNGRIGLWATVDMVGFHHAKLQGVNPEDMKIVYVISKDQHKYIAFSKQIPDDIVRQWQNVLDSIKQDGTYEKFLDKWIK